MLPYPSLALTACASSPSLPCLQGEADGSGGAGVSGPGTGADPLSLGLGLGTDFEAGDMGFPPLTGGDTGSPLAPALDEYDPDDPI